MVRAALLLALLSPADGDGAAARTKVKHFVTLLMENRAFDHIFGCMGLEGVDGIPPEGRRLYADPANASSPSVTVSCGTAPYVCSSDPLTHKPAAYPHYDIFASKFATAEAGVEPYPPANGSTPWGPGGLYPKPDKTCATPGNPCGACTYPYAPQSDALHSFSRGASGVDIELFNRSQLPVKSAIAEHFGVFNKYYTSVPSGSMPNHMFLQSATSCGATNNMKYSVIGGPSVSYPQVIPPLPSLFTRLRPYLAHFSPVFSRFLCVFTAWPRRFHRAPSRNPGPRNSWQGDQEGRTPPFVRHARR